MQAITLINLCAREYNDTAFERITKANWLAWLNDAQRNVVLVRPDANAVTQNITLVAGTKQSTPAGVQRLLGVTRNMGANGTTVGKALRFTQHEAQNDVNLDWYSATPASPVREIVYDDKKDPNSFWTRPPAIAGWQIEAITSKAPTDVTDADNGAITLQDIYSGPIQEWMLHRAYCLATQSANQFQRAQFYFSSFFNLLGVKLRGDMFAAANAAAALPAGGAK